MNHWRCHNHRAFGDQVDCTNPQETSLSIAQRSSEHFCWYVSNDLRAKIERPSCLQYKLGDFLAGKPLNWKEISNDDEDDENWADLWVPSSGRSRPGDGIDNDHCEGEEKTQGGEKGTGKGKETKDGKRNRMGNRKGKGSRKGKGQWKAIENGKRKGMWNGTGKGIVKQTLGGDDIPRPIASQLHKTIFEGDSYTEVQLEKVYLEPEVSAAVSIS